MLLYSPLRATVCASLVAVFASASALAQAGAATRTDLQAEAATTVGAAWREPLVGPLASGLRAVVAAEDGQLFERGTSARTAEQREVRRLAVTLETILPGTLTASYGDAAGTWAPREPMPWPELATLDEPLSRFYQRALALRDAVLSRGALRVLAVDSVAQSTAFERTLNGERRVVALNRSDRSQFLAFPPEAPRTPLVPILASTGDVASIASLVFVLEENGDSSVGLRIPPRTAVVFRPARDGDIRPNGLHE